MSTRHHHFKRACCKRRNAEWNGIEREHALSLRLTQYTYIAILSQSVYNQTLATDFALALGAESAKYYNATTKKHFCLTAVTLVIDQIVKA